MNLVMTFKFLFLILCVKSTLSSNRWPNHDISTLKLVQIVHRHGDRTPTVFPPNDPFKNESYWPEGVGQLTNRGKYRLYKFGQFIREEYHKYLGDNYSPREVYARSGEVDRCMESLSCLLAGAYPPKQKTWQWNNGSDAELGRNWQPFPIQVVPIMEDIVLEHSRPCPAVERETAKIYKRPEVVKFIQDNKEIYANISKITDTPIEEMYSALDLADTLSLEVANNRYWSDIWTEEQERNVIKKLNKAIPILFRNFWDSPIIKRLRAGGLVKELNENMRSVVDNKNKRKLYVYSTHDTLIAVFMQALSIFNDSPPPFGAALLFEMHEKRESSSNKPDHFVRVFYYNETEINSGAPHPLIWKDCGNKYDCSLNELYNSTTHLIYKNFDEECK